MKSSLWKTPTASFIGRVDPTLLEDVESRIPHDSAIALWDRVARLTGDPDVGLHVAEAIRPGMSPKRVWSSRPITPFSAIVCGCREERRGRTGVTWTPLEVRFSHAEPAHTSEYRRVFGAPVRFGHVRNELIVSKRVLELPLVTADAALQPIVEASRHWNGPANGST
jgi:hypothetical protein